MISEYKTDLYFPIHIFKARCWKPPGHYLCIPEPVRPDCVIPIEIGVNGDACPVAVSQKVTKYLPVSFYSPTSGFKQHGLVGYILTIYCKISAISRIVLLKKATGCNYNLLCNKKYEFLSYKSNKQNG